MFPEENTCLSYKESKLTASNEDDEKSLKELSSLPLAPKRSEPKLLSELVDICEIRPESIPSYIMEDERSVLGLPELTNDKSVSASERSEKILEGMTLRLSNGDLLPKLAGFSVYTYHRVTYI